MKTKHKKTIILLIVIEKRFHRYLKSGFIFINLPENLLISHNDFPFYIFISSEENVHIVSARNTNFKPSES